MKLSSPVMKIISGGQTGVDRAALDWAMANGLAHGGWCPKGRCAEDGTIAPCYMLAEVPQGSYRQRTRRNVLDSDGTLIFHMASIEGGTLATSRFAEQLLKPCFYFDLARLKTGSPEVDSVKKWLTQYRVATLNVAGPRESKVPGIYRLVYRVLGQIFWESNIDPKAVEGQTAVRS